MNLQFTDRQELSACEWKAQTEDWRRPALDRDLLKRLSERSNAKGLLRTGIYVALLVGSGLAAAWVGNRFSWWWSIPFFYLYFFFFGFIVTLAHELQHKILFAKSLDWLNEVLFYIVQILMWNGPTYARLSHRLHHRYTMVRGEDPETDWPAVITSKWLRQFLLKQVFRLLLVYAVIDMIRAAASLIKQVTGKLNPIMDKRCSAKNRQAIRIDALIILLVHLAVLILTIVLQKWELIFFITLPWHIGVGMEILWHNTEHIGRLYNVNDQRLATRSIRVGPFIRMIYGGLDDHVDHHEFPIVPSYNLPSLHQALKENLAAPRTVFGCWAEMIAIAREKDSNPDHEYVPVAMDMLEQHDL